MTAATEMPASEIFAALGTALGLGLLVGLEREWVKDQVAGIRTFALVTLSGALAALVAGTYGGWVIAAALVCLSMLILIGNLPALKSGGTGDMGLTTEFAMLVMFLTGMLPMLGHAVAATVIAGVVMVLLQGKEPIHGMVRRIGAAELKAIARLVLIGLVILPVLPNQDYGYYGVFNPFKIWLMVVLIVGLSLVAYLVGKIIGPNRGLLVSGLLGGLISSTATTASLSRQSKETKASPPLLALVIMIASTVVFGRVIVEILAVAPKAGQTMVYPFLAIMVWMAVVSVGCWLLARKEIVKPPQGEPPSEMKGAVMFGLLYALVLLGVAVARHNFGQAGLFTVAAISGLTDMDAITLSTANLVNGNHIDPGTGWRIILTGGVANLVFKGIMVATIGSRALAGWVAIVFGVSILGAGLIAWLWPG
ncbi:MAG TPA: DUF4010 domain-containing protein [Candidatus Saccharimonadia bacterium]|nr:DUF4010 domain-containing protein [Candidatus Saccharimonadia bacterium]